MVLHTDVSGCVRVPCIRGRGLENGAQRAGGSCASHWWWGGVPRQQSRHARTLTALSIGHRARAASNIGKKRGNASPGAPSANFAARKHEASVLRCIYPVILGRRGKVRTDF